MSSIPQLVNGNSLEHGITMFVDHGGTSGTKMTTIGQVAPAQVAAGTSHENTTTEGAASRGQIPADTLVVGSTVRIWAAGIIEDNNGSDELVIYVRLGANALPASNVAAFTSASINSEDADIYCVHGLIQIRTVGTGGTAVAMFSYQDPDAAGTAPKWQYTASFAVNTTVDNFLDLSADWNAANADNEMNSEIFVVDVCNPGV